jgi:hypothetical protein
LDQRAFLRASYEAGQDKHGIWWPADFSSGCQRRQTRAGVPSAKKQFPASKKKKEGESAFSGVTGFYFIYRMFGIYGLYQGAPEKKKKSDVNK